MRTENLHIKAYFLQINLNPSCLSVAHRVDIITYISYDGDYIDIKYTNYWKSLRYFINQVNEFAH